MSISNTAMTRNSGKRMHRRKHFVPPILKDVSSMQNYGIITKYHGGANRNMDITLYNNGSIETIKASLRGKIRNMQCKQKIIIGAYCIVECGQVMIILRQDQVSKVPKEIQEALSSCKQKDDKEAIIFYQPVKESLNSEQSNTDTDIDTDEDTDVI